MMSSLAIAGSLKAPRAPEIDKSEAFSGNRLTALSSDCLKSLATPADLSQSTSKIQPERIQYPILPTPPEKGELSDEDYRALKTQYETYYKGCDTDEQKLKKYQEELSKFSSKFKKGDIVFFKVYKEKFPVSTLISDDWIDGWIYQAQKVAKDFISGDRVKNSEANVHVGIIVKNSKGVKCLAEANLGLSGDDVRIIPLNSPGLGLNVLSKQKWEILRPTEDKDFIKPALKFVKAIADEVEYDTRGVASTATKAHYAYIGAIACLFGSAAMGMEAKKRLFLTYAKLINGIGQKDYFCSNLVSECLQLGEFKVRMKRLLQDEKIPTQDLDTWAKQMAEKYGSELDLRLTFKFDPLYVSPQKLRNLLESEYKYKQVLKITGKGAAPLT
jgi:hypothetical protein